MKDGLVIADLDPKEQKELKAIGEDLRKSGVGDISDVKNEALWLSPSPTPIPGQPQTAIGR